MMDTTGLGIIPLCDKHGKPMTTSGFPDDLFGLRAFYCNQPGCTRAYNTSNGYVEIVDGRIDLPQERQTCPRDGTAMFLESVTHEGFQNWRCTQTRCSSAVSLQLQHKLSV